MDQDPILGHLVRLREDVRAEVKQRIAQRDQYSIQLVIALGAIGVVAGQLRRLEPLLLIPMVAIYFMNLVAHSYYVHRVLGTYAREVLEPALSSALGTPAAMELETWFQAHGGISTGRRTRYYEAALWTLVLLPLVLGTGSAWSVGVSSPLALAAAGAWVVYVPLAAATQRALRRTPQIPPAGTAELGQLLASRVRRAPG